MTKEEKKIEHSIKCHRKAVGKLTALRADLFNPNIEASRLRESHINHLITKHREAVHNLLKPTMISFIEARIVPIQSGSFITTIRYFDSKRREVMEVTRLDLLLQGCEDFITEFRIKHNL
jgi:hypothetical protein